ncbi:MAG: arylsulfatase [Clostridia bacterium]
MKKPNVIIYFADDLGYGDVSCFNSDSKINTKCMDEMAKNGVKFTDVHASSAICTPSRYSLLTGRHNWRSEHQGGICSVYGNSWIKKEQATIGTMMQENGYNTAHIGKWHLGFGWDFDAKNGDFFYRTKKKTSKTIEELQEVWKEAFSKPTLDSPTHHGFDYSYGVDLPNWPPYTYIENNYPTEIPDQWLSDEFIGDNIASMCGPVAPNFKFDEIIGNLTNRAEKYIEENSQDEKPFFLYFAATTPHTPLVPSKEFSGISGLNSPYADMVLETDNSLGRIIQKVKDCGIEEDTIIIFASDNGCASYIGVDNLLEQGHHPSGIYRGYKADAWDGGHRIPFIMQWKNHLECEKEFDNLVCLTDVFATVASLTNSTYSSNSAEDSFDISSVFENKTAERDFCIHQSSTGKFAVRTSKWKLILSPYSGAGTYFSSKSYQYDISTPEMAKELNLPPIQLYDMEIDPSEKNNIALENIDIVKSLISKLQIAVENGRNTTGTVLSNDVDVDIWKTHELYEEELACILEG